MRKVFCILTALAVSLLTAQAVSLPFEKTYKSAPLYEVLQDLESHFGLQFLYRPSDIAAAQPVTLTIKTNDAHKALQQALGSSLQFTTRNGIIIITKAPEKKTPPTRVRSVVIKETPKIIIPDTLPEEEPREEWQAIPYLTPGIQIYLSPIDTLRIGEIVQINQVIQKKQNIQKNATTPITLKTPMPRKTPRDLQEKGLYLGVSLGYGSAINGQFDVRYNYYFKRNWGIGGGLNFAYCVGDSVGWWCQDIRMGVPIAAYTRWPLSQKWGVHGTLGVAPMFKIYNNGFTNLDVDLVPFAEIDAMRILSPKVTCLFGLYTRVGTLGTSAGDPWAIGFHLAFLLGK